MKTFERIFIVPDFMITMVAIDDNPGMDFTQLHYKSKITYSHLNHIKKFLEHKQWIYVQEDGRRKVPYLTDKGKEILRNIYQLLSSMDITKQDVYNYKLKEKKTDKGVIDVLKEVQNVNNEGN